MKQSLKKKLAQGIHHEYRSAVFFCVCQGTDKESALDKTAEKV